MKKTEIDKKDIENLSKEDINEWTDGYDLWKKLIIWDEEQLRNNVINANWEDLKEQKFGCNHLELIDVIKDMFQPDRKKIEKFIADKYGVYNINTKKIELNIPEKEYNKYQIPLEHRKPEILINLIELNFKEKGERLAVIMGNHINNLAMYNRNTERNFILNRGTRINVDLGQNNASGGIDDNRGFLEKLFSPKKKVEK